MLRLPLVLRVATLTFASLLPARAPGDDLAEALGRLDPNVVVLGTVSQPPLASMTSRDVAARLRIANRAAAAAWKPVETRDDWERFLAPRLGALRRSLGEFPPVPRNLKAETTASGKGDGYEVRNLIYETRPGLLVTANLYLPARPATSMPGIVICHSHHQPKHTGARQDMAMTWARSGCVVLVPDHIGHGERRQHPFDAPSPHDYHFRYDAGVHLHLTGESLMGWMAWDLMRGVDLLLGQPGVDPKRIILISEPAGGGDVAAVAGALDERIACVMVQNFGGPEPETPYPLPLDAEESFDDSGSGSWEPTRNLRLSARDGFLPWTIVASIAPRRVIYYHEFYWDREHDPAWRRLQRVWRLYDQPDALVGLSGHGFVAGSAPENTHWLAESRALLYPTLMDWFAIPNPVREYSAPRPVEELWCLTPDLAKRRSPRPLHALCAELAAERIAAARSKRETLPLAERRKSLQSAWSELLGRVAPPNPIVRRTVVERDPHAGYEVERVHLAADPGIVIPALVLRSANAGEKRRPVVVAVAQSGKQEFLRQRPEAIAGLLRSGVAVCLIDVRGTGESAPDSDRGRRGAATAVSSSEWMLGDSLLAGRLRDLRAVMSYLRGRPDLDPARIALWGESFAPVNPPETDFFVPHASEKRPPASEPMGALLVLLAGLFDDAVRAVYAHGGLISFASVLDHPFVFVPHDVVVPGVLRTGDLCDLSAALAPRPQWQAGLVDGRNQPELLASLTATHRSAAAAYEATAGRLQLTEQPASAEGLRTFFESALAVKEQASSRPR